MLSAKRQILQKLTICSSWDAKFNLMHDAEEGWMTCFSTSGTVKLHINYQEMTPMEERGKEVQAVQRMEIIITVEQRSPIQRESVGMTLRPYINSSKRDCVCRNSALYRKESEDCKVLPCNLSRRGKCPRQQRVIFASQFAPLLPLE